jgi:hypothetical protein
MRTIMVWIKVVAIVPVCLFCGLRMYGMVVCLIAGTRPLLVW